MTGFILIDDGLGRILKVNTLIKKVNQIMKSKISIFYFALVSKLKMFSSLDTFNCAQFVNV